VTNGVLTYRVIADGTQVLAPSKVGMDTDDVELGQDVTRLFAAPHWHAVLNAGILLRRNLHSSTLPYLCLPSVTCPS
jgi:hypothetical protein